jgi:carbamate kinase
MAGKPAGSRRQRAHRHLAPDPDAGRSDAGELTGVEAVVNKDLTAAELAITLNADRLLVLTDVPAVIRGYGTPDARPIPAIDAVALSAMTFPAGSMGPKVEACIASSGRPASRPRSAR